MDSSMLKKLKSQNPDKDYPSNIGKKWNEVEETLLLEELDKNIDIDTIAKNHNRTPGGINARCREIAYKMHLQNISIQDIIKYTKLNEEQITEIIKKKQSIPTNNTSSISNTANTNTITQFSIEKDFAELKTDIKELKNLVKEMIVIMKELYEFKTNKN